MSICTRDRSQQPWHCKTAIHFLVAVLAIPSVAIADPMFITFDPPKSALTQPTSINDDGTVAGFFGHQAYFRGFVRAPDGTFTTIHIRGGRDEVTKVEALNNIGATAGINWSESGTKSLRGFVRTRDGIITLFRPPRSPATFPTGINLSGVTTGYYEDAKDPNIIHGFVRMPDGSLATFDPLEGTKWTTPLAINKRGTIVGDFEDTDFVIHGFIRNANGKIVTFDVPGCPSATSASTISNSGWIGGVCGASNELGLVRSSDGTTATFAASADAEATVVTGINDDGVATGYYQDQSGTHSFVREVDGTITTFDVPGGNTTLAFGINGKGEITGFFRDSSNGQHGFIRMP